MPTPTNGQGNVPFATRTRTGITANDFVRITGTSFTTPIVVTTGFAHGFNTGDTVEQEGCQDPNANSSTYATTTTNGCFVISVLTPTTYSLNGTIGTLAGGSGGYAVSYEVQPGFNLPNGGEPASMVTLSPILQGLMNAIPWLYRLTGKRRTHMTYYGSPAAAPTTLAALTSAYATPWGSVATPTALTVYTIPGTLTALSSLSNDISGSASPIVGLVDELDIEYQATITCTLPALPTTIAIYASDGTNTTVFYDAVSLIQTVDAPSDATFVPISLRRIVTGISLSNLGLTIPGPISFGLVAIPFDSSSGQIVSMRSSAQITVVQRRLN